MSSSTHPQIKTIDPASPCPCGNDQPYHECCGVFHQGVAASTAEKLMRSRFTAYFLGDTDYLLKTTWQRQISGIDQAGIHKRADNTQWRRLDIVSKEAGGESDNKGKVEFKAWFFNPVTQKEEAHHENSDFIKEEGRWYFIYPDVAVKMPGRNDPCLCGSGKKFKKCCG